MLRFVQINYNCAGITATNLGKSNMNPLPIDDKFSSTSQQHSQLHSPCKNNSCSPRNAPRAPITPQTGNKRQDRVPGRGHAKRPSNRVPAAGSNNLPNRVMGRMELAAGWETRWFRPSEGSPLTDTYSSTRVEPLVFLFLSGYPRIW